MEVATRIMLGLTIARDGKLLRARIEESSGNRELDKQVLDAIKKEKLTPANVLPIQRAGCGTTMRR
jgi:TonB family protein